MHAPAHTLAGFTGSDDTMRAMVRTVQGPGGEKSVFVRRLTEDVLREVQPKDYLGEIVAIRNFAAEKISYKNDPVHLEYVQAPERIARDIVGMGKAVGDCDDICAFISCMALQVGRLAQFVCVGFGAPHDYSHVFARVLEPKSGGDGLNGGEGWLVCDPVAGTGERGMLERVKTYAIWSCDELPEHGPVEVYP